MRLLYVIIFLASLACLVEAYQRQMPPQTLQQLQNRCLTQQMIHNAKDKTCVTQKKVRMQLQHVEDGIFFCISYKKPLGDVYNAFDVIRISMHHDYDLQYSGANVIDYEMPSFKIYTGNEYNARFAIFSNNTQFRIYFCTINGEPQSCNYGRKGNRVWPMGNKTVDNENPSETPENPNEQIEQNQFQPPEDKREPTTPKIPVNPKNVRPSKAQNLPRTFPKMPIERQEEPSESSNEEEEQIDEESEEPAPVIPQNTRGPKTSKSPNLTNPRGKFQNPRTKKPNSLINPPKEPELEDNEEDETEEEEKEEPAVVPQNTRGPKTSKNPNLNRPKNTKRPVKIPPKEPELEDNEEDQTDEEEESYNPPNETKTTKTTKNHKTPQNLPPSPRPKKPIKNNPKLPPTPIEDSGYEEEDESDDEEPEPYNPPNETKSTKAPSKTTKLPQNSRTKKPNSIVNPLKLPQPPQEDEEDEQENPEPEDIPKEPENEQLEDEDDSDQEEPEPVVIVTTTEKITTTLKPQRTRRPQKTKNPLRNTPKPTIAPQIVSTTTETPLQPENSQNVDVPEDPTEAPQIPDSPQEENPEQPPPKNDTAQCGTIQKMVDLKHFSMRSNPGQFPFKASINQVIDGDENNQVYKCSGSIVDQSVILTSVNCLMDCNGRLLKNDELKVQVGQYSKNMRGPKSKTFDVEQILPHEQYNSNLENNIAAVKLKQNIEYDDYVQPICLPDKNTPMKLKDGDVGKLAGFDKSGLMTDSDYKINFNDEVEVLNQDPSACKTFNGENTSNDIDATALGCGLYMSNPVAPQQWILIGITSNVPHALSSNRNAAFTNVVYYGDWIDKCRQILG